MDLSKVEESVGRLEAAWTRAAKITIALLLVSIGYGARKVIVTERDEVKRVQYDEISAFVLGKDKNLSLEQVQAGFSSVWTWTAIDADSKLIVSYILGDRGTGTAQAFMRDVASRISNRIQLTSDSHRVYADALE